MNKNNFTVKFFIISVIALLLAIGAIYLVVWKNNNKLYGKLVFSETYNKGNLINKIELVSTDETVVITLKDNYWVINNKNDYYADFALVNNLLNSINKSVYHVKFPFDKEIADKKLLNNPVNSEKNSGILIRTFIGDEKIDEIIVGLPDESKNYYFSRNLKDNNIWLISENFNIPVYSKDWILHPIVNILPKQIEMFQFDDKKIKRLNKYTSFYDENQMLVNVDALVNVFSGLFVVNATNKMQFDKIELSETKNIKITTFSGLVFDISLYFSNDKKIWCNIKLSTTTLPMSIVNDYINDNKFLYDDWYFEISSEQERILRYFYLI